MKKIILAFTAIAITAGAYSQVDSTYRKTERQDMNHSQHQNMQNNSGDKLYPDGVLMQNGKMMRVKNGQMTILQDNDMTMSNGTRIMSDGTCIKTDGTKLMMKEGQHMDISGNMITTKTNRDKYMNVNSNVQSYPVDRSNADGVVMQNGKMIKMRNGQTSIVTDNDMTMSNGTRIMSDGTCIKSDGTSMTMKEGQHMDMSGNITPANSNKDRNMYLVPDSNLRTR